MRIAEKAGVPSVPNVLCKIKSYQHMREQTEDLGEHLVLQLPYGDSGNTTYFVSNEDDYNKNKEEIENEDEVKVMKRIKCRGTAIEACVTRHGTVVAPLMTELVGFKELTPIKAAGAATRFS